MISKSSLSVLLTTAGCLVMASAVMANNIASSKWLLGVGLFMGLVGLCIPPKKEVSASLLVGL